MMADVCVDLKTDESKINSSFDGYKLSLDTIPTYNKTLDCKPELVQLSANQYSFQHVKSFGNQNTLFPDPWKVDTVYFIDERWKIMKFNAPRNSDLDQPKSVLQIPNAAEQKSKVDRVSPTLSFPSPDIAFVSDGAGVLHIVKTFDRNEELLWQVILTMSPIGEEKSFKILHSVGYLEGNIQKMECLILHVDSNESTDDCNQKNKSNKSLFKSVIEWLSFKMMENKGDVMFELERTRRLEGLAPPDYGAIEFDGKGVLLASENKFKITYDSTRPVNQNSDMDIDKEGQNDSEDTDKKILPAFTWDQSKEDVNVYFILPTGCLKTDIEFKLTQTNILVGLKDSSTVLLDGELCSKVDVDESTWMVSNVEEKSAVGEFVKPDQLRLHIVLTKKDSSNTWNTVVIGDERGKMLTNNATTEEAFEIVQNIMGSEDSQKPAYNAQELEDCDDYPDENSVLLRFDGESHNISHQVNLGSHQWLFNCASCSNQPPCICIRHDVDGIIWQPGNTPQLTQVPWQHVATFNAFGYVQASKQQRRYTSCSPDFSYAVIADSVRHLYIYWQPSPTLTPLRNRKTGQTVDTVARQQLVSLETVETISGLYATSHKLFVLAGNIMHLLNVKHDELH